MHNSMHINIFRWCHLTIMNTSYLQSWWSKGEHAIDMSWRATQNLTGVAQPGLCPYSSNISCCLVCTSCFYIISTCVLPTLRFAIFLDIKKVCRSKILRDPDRFASRTSKAFSPQCYLSVFVVSFFAPKQNCLCFEVLTFGLKTSNIDSN
jgi:hypothetical protein